MLRKKMSHWFRRGSITPALLLAVYTLSIFSVILLKATPAKAANANKADVATYNALVGFKKQCELTGGSDKKLTDEDYQNEYDNSKGSGAKDNGNDPGTQIVIGLAAYGDLGVVTCSFVSDNVAKAINTAKGWDLKVDNNTDARNLIVLLLSNSQKDAVDYYKSNGSNSDPFRDGYAKINVSWSDFSKNYLDPAISLYRGKAAPQSAGMVASKLWMALNHCFYWGDKPFVNSENYVNSNTYKLYGRKQDYGKYTSADFKKIIPNYSDRSGYTESGKDKLGDIELGFEATDADVSAKFEVGSNWFPFGYDISLVKSGLSNPIISCSEMRSFFSDYASALEYDNPGKVKIKAGTPDGDPGNGGGGSNGGGSNGGGTGPEVNCSTKLLNPLTWFMCPLIELATKTVKALDGEIMDLLEIDVGKELNEKSGDGKKYYESWSTFRFIALSLLVVIGLIMIISQAFSFGIFDAYTIKKIAPRILIAVIFIALSWPVTKFAIEISNDLGKGVRGIITAPFPDKVDILGGTESILALGVAGAAVALGALGLLSFALTALMAVLIAFFVLVVRKMLIFFLVILAPVAIICSILPNTQKVWKMWWDFFSKALLTFPIVAGMIAIGHSFAVVASRDKGLAGQAVAFIAYFGPYFIIPTAFKMAGGAIGQISGMVGDKSKGGFDRLKNFRGNQRKQKTQDLLSGNRLRGGNQDNFRGRVNRGLLGASKVGQMGVDPTRWRSRMRTAMNDSQEMSMEDQMKNSSFGVWGADDAKLHAARFTDRDQIAAELERQDAGRFGGEQNRRAREDAVTQIERTQREMGTQAFHRARVRAQAKTGTGYIDANGVFDSAAMLDDINMAYGSDRNGAGRALAEMRTSLTNSGQIAGQAGYGTWAQQMENTYNAQGQDQATRDAVHEAAHMAIMDDTIDSVAPGNALYGKPSSAAAVGAAHARRIQAISAGIQAGTHTEDDLSAAVAAAAGIYDAMGQASPGNASAMANELMGVALPDGPSFTTNQQETVYNPATGTPMIDATGRPVTRTVTSTVKPATVREYIEAQMNGNPEFVDRRRDLSQAAWRQAQQQQAQQQQGPQPPQAGPQINPQVGPPGP